MRIAVSPYHLTSREPPALAALLLADEVVTLAPEPAGRDDEDRKQAAGAPAFLAFMESWQWSTRLWREGVLSSYAGGAAPSTFLEAAADRLDDDPACEPIRRFVSESLRETGARAHERVALDILKGGPDPAVNIPVHAALDAYAAASGSLVARSPGSSLAQGMESAMGERRLGLAVPLLIQAGAGELLRARDLLSDELRALRTAISIAIDDPSARDALATAGSAYSSAFEEFRVELLEPEDDRDPRVIDAVCSLSFTELPVDAAFRSSVLAAGAASRRRRDLTAAGSAIAPAAERTTFLGMTVRAIGR